VAACGNAVRIIRHRGEDVAWELARRRPDPGLGPQVIAYTGYVETRGPVIRRREVASTVVPVIVNFGPDFRLLDRDDADAHRDHRSCRTMSGCVSAVIRMGSGSRGSPMTLAAAISI
jgi:hypothetical protein